MDMNEGRKMYVVWEIGDLGEARVVMDFAN